MSYQSALDQLSASHNLRTIPADTASEPMVDLSTNDYLGLGSNKALRTEFMQQLTADNALFSASASRLLAANQRDFDQLEKFLAELYSRHILLFNSGYHANVGAISSLASEGRTLILADKLVHASIIDGMVLSRAPFERFRHNDVSHLERLLAKHSADYERIIIVTESVFSMDGDTAPLSEIAEVKRRYAANTLLYVDEAHAFGALGAQGLGLCSQMPDVDVIIGTLGKAAASAGAFAACRSAAVRDYLINRARSFIFSTAIAPINCKWSKFVIEHILTMDAERLRLRRLGELLQKATGAPTPSHIQPLIVGSSAKALELSARLRTEGFKVLPIRTPTVPAGTERLRFSLSLEVTEAQLERLSTVMQSMAL
jgi:8-amino-7-oxononanoate synthase